MGKAFKDLELLVVLKLWTCSYTVFWGFLRFPKACGSDFSNDV